jgi:hypothetical protein
VPRSKICAEVMLRERRLVSRVCTICSHDRRDEIEDAFIAGTPKRRIASQHGVTERAVRHHMREHLPELLALARDAERAARADTLLDRIEALQSRTLATLDEAEHTDDYRARLAAIREARANLELIGEVTKEINRTPTLELHLNPEWLKVQAVIVSALEPYSEAKDAVVSGIKELENGNVR